MLARLAFSVRSAVLRTARILIRNRLWQSLARAIVVAFVLLIVVFSLVRLIPGDPVLILLGDLATPQLVAKYREVMGLNGSIFEQFAAYMSGVLRGNLGTSLNTGISVTSTVTRTLPVTAWLLGVTIFLDLIVGVPLGVVAAIYRRTWFGQLFRLGTSLLLATPVFYSGLLLILIFAIWLGIAPVAGYENSFPQNLRYLWLPGLTLAGVLVPIFARVLQSSIVDTLEEEFVETAIVRGLPRSKLIWRYLLRPSLAPTISLLGYQIGQLLSGAVIVEIVFNLPGIGTSLVLEGVLRRDYPIVQGIVLVFGLIVVAVSFLADVVSGWLDPRTRTT